MPNKSTKLSYIEKKREENWARKNERKRDGAWPYSGIDNKITSTIPAFLAIDYISENSVSISELDVYLFWRFLMLLRFWPLQFIAEKQLSWLMHNGNRNCGFWRACNKVIQTLHFTHTQKDGKIKEEKRQIYR